MKRILVISSLLCAHTAFAAEKVQTIRHENCEVISGLLDDSDLREKNYTRASFDIITRDRVIKSKSLDNSELVGPFSKDNENQRKTTENELKATLNSLHVSDSPHINYFKENGEKLNLVIDSTRNHVMSLDTPRFPLDNSQKIYFEISVSVDRASIKERQEYWVYLKKTPVAENVIFRSKVFSFSQVAKELTAKEVSEDTDVLLKIIAKNDKKEMAELAKDPSAVDSINFAKQLLVEYVRLQAMGEDMEQYQKLMKDAIPSCEIAP